MRRENGQQQVQESKPIFELYLLHGQIRYCLDLPAEELQLDMTKRSLGVEDFAQAAIYQTKCEICLLYTSLPVALLYRCCRYHRRCQYCWLAGPLRY